MNGMRPDGRSKAAFRSNPDELLLHINGGAQLWKGYGGIMTLRAARPPNGGAEGATGNPRTGWGVCPEGVGEEGGDSRGGDGGKAK